jgi:DNA-binding IclR family transcriptional regulator
MCARRQEAQCVGAPVLNESSAIEASLGLSGTIRQVTAQTVPRIVEALNHATRHRRMRIEGKLRNLRDDS